MSAKTWLYLFLLLGVLVIAGLGYLFWVQNSQQVATASLELWGVGRYGRAWKVPELIAVSGAVGFVLGFLPMWVSRLRAGRRIRQLEQQVAMSGSKDGGSSAWR